MVGLANSAGDPPRSALIVDALDLGAEPAQALVDALVTTVDLLDRADLRLALAHSAAISIAIPARMSGETSFAPRSRVAPLMTARCGSQRMMFAPIATSLSVKTRRFSNIFSNIRTAPSDCVASATAIDVRSAGNAGHGPSSTLIW